MYRDLLILCLLFGCTLTISANEKVIVAGDNWCPINCGEKDQEKGYMIDVATHALALSGYELVYLEMPWARAISLARRGEIHAIVGAFEGDAPDFYFPHLHLLKISPNHLFTLKESQWQYDNIRSLNDVNLGAIKGYDYGELLNNYIKSMDNNEKQNVNQLFGNDAVQRNILALIKNRIDVIVESGPVFWYQTKKMGMESEFKEAGVISEPEPCYIAFSPKHSLSEKLTLALDSGIAQMKQQGQLESIAQRYGIPSSMM